MSVEGKGCAILAGNRRTSRTAETALSVSSRVECARLGTLWVHCIFMLWVILSSQVLIQELEVSFDDNISSVGLVEVAC